MNRNLIESIRGENADIDIMIKERQPQISFEAKVAARRHYQLMATLRSIDSHLESIADSIALLTIERTNP